MEKVNLNDVSTQLLYATMPIWVEYADGRKGSATGTIFMLPIPANPQASIPLLVTNHHVVKSAKRGLIELAESEEGRPVAGKRLRVEIDAKFLLGNMNPQDDLSV